MAALRGAPSALRFSKAFAMNITKDTAVTINYKITDKLGKLLDKGDVAYLHGGYDNIFAKVEAALDGKAVGDTLTVDLARSEEHTSELQSQSNLVCRLLLEKKKTTKHS